MVGATQEGLGLRGELVDADAGEGSEDAGGQGAHVGVVPRVVLGDDIGQPAVVTLVGGLPGLPFAELGLLSSHGRPDGGG